MPRKTISTLFWLFLIAGIGLLAVRTLLAPGFFLTHDGSHLMVRMGAAWQALREGQFPLRWSGILNHYYGYPVFNFLYPLYLYIGSVLFTAGFGLVGSFKLILFTAFVFSGMAMFLFLQTFLPDQPAVIGALTYMLNHYRFTQIYIRGSIGEVLAMALAPLVLYFLSLLSAGKSRLPVVGTAVSISLLTLSHNTLALLFLLMIGGYMVLKAKEKQEVLKSLIVSAGLGIGLSCFFCLPAIREWQFTVSARAPITDFSAHFVAFGDLFSEKWQFGFSDPSGISSMSYSLGLFTAPFLLLSVFFLWKNRKKKKVRNSFIFPLLVFLISVLLMVKNPLTAFIWQLSHVTDVIQFPWRLLAVAVLAIAWLAGLAYHYSRHRLIKLILITAIFGQIINSQRLNLPYQREYYPDDYYLTNDGTTTTSNEFLPVWVQKPPTNRPPAILTAYNTGGQEIAIEYEVVKNTSQQIELAVNNNRQADIVLNKLYFPGWKVNGRPPDISPNGLISFSLPPAEKTNKVSIVFTNTPVRSLSNIISAVSVLTLLWLALRKRPL